MFIYKQNASLFLFLCTCVLVEEAKREKKFFCWCIGTILATSVQISKGTLLRILLEICVTCHYVSHLVTCTPSQPVNTLTNPSEKTVIVTASSIVINIIFRL